VNLHLKQDKLQQMKKEIVLLREELAAARQEASKMAVSAKSTGDSGSDDASLISSSKPSKTWETGGLRHQEEGRVYESGGPVKADVLHQLNRASAALTVYSRCFRTVREMLGRALTEKTRQSVSGSGDVQVWEERKGEDTKHLKRSESLLSHCLKVLDACEREENGDEATDPGRLHPGSLGSSAQDQVFDLRSELEECKENLRRDRQVFAENMEELEELRSACEWLSEQKERAEAMWIASQDNETRLTHQLQLLESKVAMLQDNRSREAKDNGGSEGGLCG